MEPGARIRALLNSEGLPVVHDLDPAGTNTHANVMDSHGARRGIPIIPPALRLATVVAGMTVSSPDLFYHDLDPALLEREFRRHFGGR